MLQITNSSDNISLSLLKGLITIDFNGKGATVKNASNYQFFRQYFTFFIERTHHYGFPWERYNCKECFQLPVTQTMFNFIDWKDSSLLISLKKRQI